MGFMETFWAAVAEGESSGDTHLEAWQRLRGRGLPEMRVVADILQPYQGWNAVAVGECRVRLYTDAEDGFEPIAVLTDLHRGPSVMNMVEDVATRLTVRFSLPPQTLWVLHLPYDYLGVELLGDKEREQFWLVTFDPRPGSSPWGSDPNTDFRKLSGAEIDQLRYWLPLSVPLPDSVSD